MRRKLLCLTLSLLSLLAYSCDIGMPDKLRGTWRTFTTPDGLTSRVAGVAVASNESVWFATEHGVSVLTAKGDWTHYRATNGLGADDARGVLVDQRGRVWVATAGGVSRFDGATWLTFTSANSNLPDDSILRLAIDVHGDVWVLSLGGLSVVHNDDTVTHIGTPLSGKVFYSLAVDFEGHVWVATDRDPLLAEYDPGGQQWHVVGLVTDHVELSTEHSSPLVWEIAADRQPGHLWIAANSIVEVEEGAWRVHLPRYRPDAVFVDADGYKWFSVSSSEGSGLLLLSPDNQQWWFYSGGGFSEGIPDLGSIREITRDSQGNYWFATFFGAIRFAPAR